MNRIRLSGTAAALFTALLPLPQAAAEILPPPPVKDKKPAATAPPSLAAEAPAAAIPDSEALPGKWEELIRTYTSPEDLENVGGDAEEIKEAASDFAKENGETFIRVFKKIRDTAPEMSGNDTIATWQLPEPVGGEEGLTLFLKDGRWFIQDP